MARIAVVVCRIEMVGLQVVSRLFVCNEVLKNPQHLDVRSVNKLGVL